MTIEVEGPGGVVIEFPDGTPSETIKSVMVKQFGKPVDFSGSDDAVRKSIEARPEGERSNLYREWARRSVSDERKKGLDMLPSAARGIPIIGGLVDEGAALAESGLHSLTGGYIGRPYDESLAFQRERHRQAEAARPGLAFGSQLAAGIATGGGLFGRLTPATTTLGRIGQGSTIGATVGAAEGFTRGEGGFHNRLGNAGDGAAFGAGVGAALPLAGDLIGRGVTVARDHISPTITRLRSGVEDAADEILANRIYASGSTPGATRLDLQRGQARAANLASNSRATLPETIADTSDSMQRLTGSLYRSGGEAGDFVRDMLRTRQRGMGNLFSKVTSKTPDGQSQRIMDATERALLIKSADSARQTERGIISKMKADGQNLYKAAYNASEPFDLQGVLDGMALKAMQYPKPFQMRMERALNLFRDESPKRFPVSNIERFDAAKKALDDMIDTAQRQGQGNLVRELTVFKSDLLDAVHARNASGAATRNLKYQEAREAWGSAAENREAIELGRAALRENAEISAEQFRNLTSGQQQFFRLGFLESLRNALGSKRRGSDVTQLFETNRVRELMSEIIPRSKGRAVFSNRPERFGDYIDREARMVSTDRVVLGNSATAQRQQDDAAFAGDALASMWNRFRASPSLFNMGVEAIGAGIQKVFGYRQDVAVALARRLLEQDPTVRNQILRRLQRRSPNNFARFAKALDRSVNTLIPATTPQLVIEGER